MEQGQVATGEGSCSEPGAACPRAHCAQHQGLCEQAELTLNRRTTIKIKTRRPPTLLAMMRSKEYSLSFRKMTVI